jgi:hypothetical protein
MKRMKESCEEFVEDKSESIGSEAVRGGWRVLDVWSMSDGRLRSGQMLLASTGSQSI